jgi:hypothetical protein
VRCPPEDKTTATIEGEAASWNSQRSGGVFIWLDALLVDHAIFRLVWSNFAVVIPGRLYRSNHPRIIPPPVGSPHSHIATA